MIEVAISVQFEELPRFGVVDYGLLWERWRDRFPETQYQAPLLPVVEIFGGRRARSDEIRIEPIPPLGRCWYRTANRERLIQVQPDRFILNWQRAEAGTPYPSYDALRSEFAQALGEFLAHVADRRLGDFEPTQCELIYVNHLLAGREWARPGDLADVLVPLAGQAAGPPLPDVEDVRASWKYRFDDAGAPIGRLHVDLYSAERGSGAQPVFVLQMTGRGAPRTAQVDGVLAFTDQAHEWITHAFAALTTARMHTLWERQR